MTLEQAINEFLEQQDDSHEDEWYGTDKSIMTTVMKDFNEYLIKNGITFISEDKIDNS